MQRTGGQHCFGPTFALFQGVARFFAVGDVIVIQGNEQRARAAILYFMMGKTGCLTSFSLAGVSGQGRVIGTKLRRTRLFDIKSWSVGLIGPGAAAVLFLFTALVSAAGLDAVDPLFG